MAKSILSLNMVSIGILLSDANIDITIEDLAEKVTSWQTQNNRIFGVTEDDFINSLLMLVMSKLNLENGMDDLYKLTFQELIPDTKNETYHICLNSKALYLRGFCIFRIK
jgi:hypothetical protein